MNSIAVIFDVDVDLKMTYSVERLLFDFFPTGLI